MNGNHLTHLIEMTQQMYIAVNIHYHPRILSFELYRQQQQQQQHKLYLHDYNYVVTVLQKL